MRLDRNYLDGALDLNVEEVNLHKLGLVPRPLKDVDKRQVQYNVEKWGMCGEECGIIPHLLVGYVIKLQLVVQRFAVNAQQLCRDVYKRQIEDKS